VFRVLAFAAPFSLRTAAYGKLGARVVVIARWAGAKRLLAPHPALTAA
jgi:hypothetical protein